MRFWDSEGKRWRLGSASPRKTRILIHALPIFHTRGLFVATNIVLMSGASMFLAPKFDMEVISACLPRATVMMGVPIFYTRLLQEAWLDRKAVANMRLFVSGSAASGRYAPGMVSPHWPQNPRTLRHDRNQQDHVETL
jgi:acyl-CoA synthetase (AMP-forming)/AMP-acid ligase II